MGSGDLGGADDVAWWRGEAARWRAEAERQAQDNRVLQARVADLEGQVGALGEKVATLARLAFGKSSEKAKRAAREDPAGGDPAGGDPEGGQPKRRGRGQRRGSRGHGRRDYSHLRTREQVHDIPAGERVCPCCGAGYTPFGEETCEQIDRRVEPARIVHRRPTYRRTCRCPVRGVLVAPLVPKGDREGPVHHRFPGPAAGREVRAGPPHPPDRRRAVPRRARPRPGHPGRGVHGLCRPTGPTGAGDHHAQRRRGASACGRDVLAGVRRGRGHRQPPLVVAGVRRPRHHRVPHRPVAVDDDGTLPDTLPEGRRLLLSSDFYAVYQSPGRLDGVENLGCWAHIRRYFVRAGDAYPELRAWTQAWVGRIAALYTAHTALSAATPGSDARTLAATQFSTALDDIDAQRRAQTARPELLHPAARKVSATLDREWDGLARHRVYPDLPLDDDTSERALRGPVIGRKNFHGSSS